MRSAFIRAWGVFHVAMAAGVASAAPIVDWDYTVSSAFVTSTGTTSFVGAGPGTNNGCELVSSAMIAWGSCPAGAASSSSTGRSGIAITNAFQSGTLTTNGVAEPANTYTHFNNVVSTSHATLLKATVQATLGLRAQGSDDPYVYQEAVYTIFFSETPNTAGTCVATSPADAPCNDIWVLDGSLNRSIELDGYNYFFSFFASPRLSALPDDVCAAANAASNCIGFTTAEDQANEINFLLQVTSTPLTLEVPEPGSLALVAAGLLGLVGLRRRHIISASESSGAG